MEAEDRDQVVVEDDGPAGEGPDASGHRAEKGKEWI